MLAKGQALLSSVKTEQLARGALPRSELIWQLAVAAGKSEQNTATEDEACLEQAQKNGVSSD
jgi:hypothetical protein